MWNMFHTYAPKIWSKKIGFTMFGLPELQIHSIPNGCIRYATSRTTFTLFWVQLAVSSKSSKIEQNLIAHRWTDMDRSTQQYIICQSNEVESGPSPTVRPSNLSESWRLIGCYNTSESAHFASLHLRKGIRSWQRTNWRSPSEHWTVLRAQTIPPQTFTNVTPGRQC
jgi:hypothetical protein